MFHYNLLDKITIIIYLIKWSTFIVVLCLEPFSLDHYQTHYIISHLLPFGLYTLNLEHITFTKLQEITQMYTIHDF
jgi:hypothetical protein